MMADTETAGNGGVRDEQGRFIRGNPGGPGRPAGRRDRINAALDALRDHYGTATQAEAIRAFVREVLSGLTGTAERLDLLRLLLPRESSADLRVEDASSPALTDEDRAAEDAAILAAAEVIRGRMTASMTDTFNPKGTRP